MARVVIVGGGVAGLSAGIYSAMSGHEVTVCERCDYVGGNLVGWHRRGYVIDNCIHWLTGTNPATDTYKMWCELGVLGDVAVKKLPALYTFELSGERISLCRSLDELRDRMLKVSECDRGRILSLIKAIKCVQGMCGIGGEGHDEPVSALSFISSVPCLVKYYKMSTGELARSFQSPLLCGFLRSLLGEDFSAIALIFVFAHFTGENADLPEGGSLAAAKRMERRFLSLGGIVRVKCEVARVICDGSRAVGVLLTSGERIDADYVVMGCDVKPMYERLLGRALPRALERRYSRKDMQRFSSYQSAFAVPLEELPFSEDYIFELPRKYRGILMSDYLILREFSHEKTFSPSGCSVIQTLTFLSENASREFIKMRRENPEGYRKKKRRLGEILEKVVAEHFPVLRGKLSLLDLWTPATYERYTGAEVGSYMSFLLPKSCLPTKVSSRIPGLKNVLLATQWQGLPGGLPTAAEYGRDAADKIDLLESTEAVRNRQRVKRRKADAKI